MKYFTIFFFISLNSFAQNDSINLLDEVKLSGNLSKKINCGFHIQVIKDSVINSNTISLGNLLQQHANLYFKQNGNSMVSSISLRGTGASHTGVYWNGIAINSSLNGQTDFNTLSANSFDEIEIRKGSGSTLFGSGAIGGVINLKDKINYHQKNINRIGFGLGSYNKQNLLLLTSNSINNLFYKVSLEGVKSNNNYPYLDTEIINENAKFNNYQIKTVLAYKINHNNQIIFFTNYSNNNRELSRTLTASSKNLYKNEDNRLMINWINTGVKYNSNLKIAFLNENYKFFLDKDISDFSSGKTTNYLLKYDITYFIKKQTSFQIGIENKYIQGNGNNLLKKEQNVLEAYSLFHHKLFNKLMYNVSFRKGQTTDYNIPLIYTVDAQYKLSKTINLRTNYSTNYKLPSFNDLYWEYSGNENLKPETSNAFEFGLDYNIPFLNSSINIYQIKSKNLIQWQPVSATFWKPKNVQTVTSSGIEFDLEYKLKFNKHQISIKSQYSYTKSMDERLKKQLIYIPYHKLSNSFNYKIRSWNFNYLIQYTSNSFTTTSNTESISEYWVNNIQLNKNIIKNKINIGFNINNLFNKNYQIVAYRPMPNRNYNININIKI